MGKTSALLRERGFEKPSTNFFALNRYTRDAQDLPALSLLNERHGVERVPLPVRLQAQRALRLEKSSRSNRAHDREIANDGAVHEAPPRVLAPRHVARKPVLGDREEELGCIAGA